MSSDLNVSAPVHPHIIISNFKQTLQEYAISPTSKGSLHSLTHLSLLSLGALGKVFMSKMERNNLSPKMVG